MKNIIVTIIGLVSLSVITDVILPSGKTAKYVKGIIAVINIIVILNSLADLYIKYFS